ncbi:MAG: acyl-CoA dehydrogenase family protein [Acidimicrobiales bacterium]
MTDSQTQDQQASKVDDAITTLLAANDPASMSSEEFRGARYDHGLAWVQFPEGFGGLGVRPGLQALVEKGMREAGAAPMDPALFFLVLAGPTIATHGSDEQRNRFLRPMFTGEEVWCQLFSEPGAGSDFAGLAASAVRDGDEWTINGQKVWNTMAHVADWAMLVTRSDPDQPKHKGMTYFALDMAGPGVEVRPLYQITGEAEFNEVYLTNAKVADANRIGAEGEGWRVALTTLMNERSAIGGGSAGKSPVSELFSIWEQMADEVRSAATRDQMMQMYVRSEVLRLTNARASAAARSGNPGPEGSVAKLAMAELNKDLFELAINMMGMAGQVGYDYTLRRPESLDVAGTNAGPRHGFLRVRANSIEGGTSEIMRNILGEQVLGLPGEPRVDKAIPWKEVPRS